MYATRFLANTAFWWAAALSADLLTRLPDLGMESLVPLLGSLYTASRAICERSLHRFARVVL